MTIQETIEVLRMAGWVEGRTCASVTNWEVELQAKGGFTINDASKLFLTEFGGLCWPKREPGEHLSRFNFNFDPTSAVFEDDRFDEAGQEIGEHISPVGEVVNGHYFLGISDSGVFYLVGDDVQRISPDVWKVLDQLLSVR